DFVEPHIPDDVLFLGFVRKRAGERERRADLDYVGSTGGGHRHGNYRSRRGRDSEVPPRFEQHNHPPIVIGYALRRRDLPTSHPNPASQRDTTPRGYTKR